MYSVWIGKNEREKGTEAAGGCAACLQLISVTYRFAWSFQILLLINEGKERKTTETSDY